MMRAWLPLYWGPRPAENKMEHMARRPEPNLTAVSIAGASCAHVRASMHPSPRDARQSSCARGSHCTGAQNANHNQTPPDTTHNQSRSKWYRGPWPMTRPLPCPANVPGPKTKTRWDISSPAAWQPAAITWVSRGRLALACGEEGSADEHGSACPAW